MTGAPIRPAISGSARCRTTSPGTAATRRSTTAPPAGSSAIAADGASQVEKTGIGITNTLCWSPDNKLFYCGDTLTNTIYVWDYDAKTGSDRQ